MPRVIERLNRRHDRTAFDCGFPALNGWLQHYAGQFDRRNLARTYVLCDEAAAAVLGYFALSSRSIAVGLLPASLARGLPRVDVPVVLLGRLAIDRTMQGQRLGSHLLTDAFRRILAASDAIGIGGVEVDAIDDSAVAFYGRFGFVALRDNPHHLFLPINVIRRSGFS